MEVVKSIPIFIYDIVGALVALLGVGIIYYAPRN
jgi:drug/metabolite transporter superfamily protein YnfA